MPALELPTAKTHYVVDYAHIDNPHCFRSLRDALRSDTEEGILEVPFETNEAHESALRTALAALFTEAGWEGDGQINCMFVPPCFIPDGDTWGQIVYHVKQSNNGTSWLAIPHGLRLGLPEGFHTQMRKARASRL